MPIVLFYSLLPDIDHKNSTITWFLLFVLLALLGFGTLLNQQLLILLAFGGFAVTLISVVAFKHRGFTHSVLFGLIVASPLLLLGMFEFVVGFTAFYSHLLADGLFFKLK